MGTINDRIAKIVAESGLSKTEFAKKIRVSQQYISKLTKEGIPSNRIITDICCKFHIHETWLRTGEGEMLATPPKDALDDLVQKYGLSARGKIIIERFLRLDPDIQEAVADYIEEIATAFVEPPPTAIAEAEPAAPDSGEDIQVPTTAPVVPPGYTSRAEMEAEARAEAEEYYREILEEKRRAAESSASQSDTGERMA